MLTIILSNFSYTYNLTLYAFINKSQFIMQTIALCLRIIKGIKELHSSLNAIDLQAGRYDIFFLHKCSNDYHRKGLGIAKDSNTL